METTKIKMDMDGTIRAKVLQYKSDGNTLTEKWESLTSYADGIYYHVDKGTINGDIANFVFEKNGVYWDAVRCDRVEYIDARRDILIADLRDFEENVISRAERGEFINKLHIEVMRRLGHDTAPLYVSREAYIKNREEEERKRAEEAERRERERKEAEERRKAELLADGKEKLLNGEKITVEQIELIAGAVGYKINIRTLGTMRKKLVSMSYSEANGWDYSYYSGKNTSDRNFKGAMDALRAIYIILKSEECERESAQGTECTAEIPQSEQSEQATETHRISTETAETANVSAEGEKGAETRENTPKRKIQYFHYTPEQLKRYIIDVYEKNANGEWVLLPYKQIDTDKCFWNVINGKIGEWDRMQERFTEVNMDFNSPTCGRCFKINRTYQQDYFIVSNEKLLEFTINGNYYYIQKQTYSKGKHRWCYTIMDAYGDFAVDDFSYTKRGIMQRFNKWWKKNATIIWQASETPTEPPQSPETPHKA